MVDLTTSTYLALTTFRRDGRPVLTPVWAAVHEGLLVVYTPSRSGKVRRIRHTPQVRVAASDFTGEDRGPELPGTARVLPDDRSREARRALGRKYGWRFHWFRLVLLLSRARRHGGRPVVVTVDLERPGRARAGSGQDG